MSEDGGERSVKSVPICAVERGGNGNGAQDVVAKLIQQELSLVDIVARQVYRHINGLVELEELVSAGREGLFDAARRYDPDQGVPFRAFANFRVRGAMLDAVNKATWLPRKNRARLRALQALGYISEGSVAHVFIDIQDLEVGRLPMEALDDHIGDLVSAAELASECIGEPTADDPHFSSNPEEAYADKELFEFVRDAIDSLNPSEANAIRCLYLEGKSLEETALALNREKPWACKLQKRGISRLAKRLQPLIE
jgi:RNA polymerase sigma factor for flagellar operon FliA